MLELQPLYPGGPDSVRWPADFRQRIQRTGQALPHGYSLAIPLMPASPLERLRQQRPVILPSMLQCNFANLAEEVRKLEAAGVQGYHLDVMDGNFVGNLTYGMPIVAAMRRLTELPLDVHLMIEAPQRYLAAFREAGADVLTVHAEACPDLAQVVTEIRDLGAAAGVAINPDTTIDVLEPVLPLLDLVLVMSVPAGFGGQSFVESSYDRLKWVRQQAGDKIVLEIDGGVKTTNIGRCAQAGAELIVVGSAIFGNQHYDQALQDLTKMVGK